MSEIKIEHAPILRGSFKNFSGIGTQYNAEGRRNFHVVIDNQEDIDQLRSMGFAIKVLEPKDPQDQPVYHLKVTVKYHDDHSGDPKIYKILVDDEGNAKSKILLDANSVRCLDYDDIMYADLKITPYHWSYAGKEGVTAYLVSMYAIVKEDEFDSRYKIDDDETIPFE